MACIKITTRPNMTIKLRTIAPIIREINVSKKARICTAVGPSTEPADICLNGAKSVDTSNPTEK